MYNSFISVVGLVVPDEQIINKYITNVQQLLKDNFSDYEIVLVNNRVYHDLKKLTQGIAKEIRKDVTIINLSKNTHNDNAIVSGLDRANGDYTVILDMEFYDRPGLILDMYKKSQENNDVVYLKFKKRRLPFNRLPFYHIYYWIIKHFTTLTMDIHTHKNRMISRRALNSILTIRENMQYMKGIYSLVGFRSTYIETDIPEPKSMESFNDQVRTALIAITSFSDLLNRMLLWIFVSSTFFSLFVIVNGVLIKFFHHDIFGISYHNTPPGWTFLVVLMSVIFVVLTFALYIQNLFLSGIYNEIKKRPLYIIESIQRI